MSHERPILDYKTSGVDIDAGNEAVRLLSAAVTATHGPAVLAGVGAFGGLFDLAPLAAMKRPVLAASTDGVGTKVRLAAAHGRLAGVGVDLVNHCVDDILVQGAEPLFFLDYVAASRIDPRMVAAVVGGMASACAAAGCALLGGETAEMPGVYVDGELDVAGTIVGAVDRDAIITGARITEGDAVIALASSGPHTNGYSLIRRILGELDPAAIDIDGAPLLDRLLEPHRSYLDDVRALRAAGVDIHGLAHITGGGLIENPPRVLPPGLAFHLDRSAWTVPPLFRWLQHEGRVRDHEMHRVFNMGLGLLVVVPAADRDRALAAAKTEAYAIGAITARGDGPPVVFDPPFSDAAPGAPLPARPTFDKTVEPR